MKKLHYIEIPRVILSQKGIEKRFLFVEAFVPGFIICAEIKARHEVVFSRKMRRQEVRQEN